MSDLLLLSFLPLIFLAHWLGDYIIQLALGIHKKKSYDTTTCLVHVAFYTCCYFPVCLIYCNSILGYEVALGTIFLTHFLQDRFKFPLNFFIKKIEPQKEWKPVLYIAFDNGYHLLVNTFIILAFIK